MNKSSGNIFEPSPPILVEIYTYLGYTLNYISVLSAYYMRVHEVEILSGEIK